MWCFCVGSCGGKTPLLILQKRWLFFCQSVYRVVFFVYTMTANGLQLPEGGDFTTELHLKNCTSNIHKTVLRSTEPPLLGRCCYRQWFCLLIPCPPCFQRFLQSNYLLRKTIFCQLAMSGRERFNFCEAREFFSVLPCVCFWHIFLFAGRLSSLPPAGTRTAMC